jgi:hypothetical protein
VDTQVPQKASQIFTTASKFWFSCCHFNFKLTDFRVAAYFLQRNFAASQTVTSALACFLQPAKPGITVGAVTPLWADTISQNPHFIDKTYFWYTNIYGTSDVESPRNYPYFDVMVELVCSHDPKSYAGGSVCYW